MYNGEDKRQRNSKPDAISIAKEFGSAGFSQRYPAPCELQPAGKNLDVLHRSKPSRFSGFRCRSIPRSARKRRQRAPRLPPRPLQSLTLCISRSVQSPIDRMRTRIVASFSEDRPNLPIVYSADSFIVERCCFLFCSSLGCELAVFMI